MPPKKRIARHQFRHSGWSPSNDPEWRYRKTLSMEERDYFDAHDGLAKVLIVSTWTGAGEPKQHELNPVPPKHWKKGDPVE